MHELASTLEPAADAPQQQANACDEHAGSQKASVLMADEAAVLAASRQLAAAVGQLPPAEHLSEFAAQLCPHTGSAFAIPEGVMAAGGGTAAAGQDLSARWKQIAADSLAMLSDSEVRCGAILGSAGCACKAL